MVTEECWRLFIDYWKVCLPCSFLIFVALVISDVMIALYTGDIGGIICLMLLSFICFMWNILYPIGIWDWIKKEEKRTASNV